jgi:hypothetical protein
MGNVHPTIFKVLHKKFKAEDELLLSKCKQLQDVKVEQLGVPLQFAIPLPLAVSKIIDILLQFSYPLPLAVSKIIDILLQFAIPLPLAVNRRAYVRGALVLDPH